MRLVPEDPVGSGSDRRVGPGTDERAKLGPVGARRPDEAAVVEDLTDLRVGGCEETLRLAAEGVADLTFPVKTLRVF
jgi:hypothetical protein